MSSTSDIRQSKFYNLRARLKACALAVVCALLVLSMAAPTTQALADVKKSDIVYGGTVEAQGLTVAECPDIESDYAIVMDGNGTFIFERDADTKTHIASITKVMTAIVSLENGNLTDVISVSDYAAEIGESSAGLQSGDTMTLETALLALMVPSGNDAAEALCEYYGKQFCIAAGNTSPTDDEAISAFVAKMNETAAKLGMTNSLFANPHGLDDGEHEAEMYSTARDVVTMCAYAMNIETFRNSVNKDTVTITVNRGGEKADIELTSTDELLGAVEGQCGVKTGYTDAAGACFAGAVNRDGSYLFTVCLHAADELQRFTDTETLIDWYYDNLIDYPITNTSEYASTGGVQSIPVIARIADKDYVDKTVRATFADPTQTLKVFKLHGNVSQKLVTEGVSGTIHEGDVVGYVVFLQHNEEVGRVNLVAIDDVEAPNVLESIGCTIDRFIRGITGQSTVASSTLVNQPTLLNDKKLTS